jgi:hypothetical protein
MSSVVLILGPVVFQDFEVPGGIVFGGRQNLAIHQLTDGRRIVDCIGPEESEIAFTGAFSGPDAAVRARLLNGLRVSGGKLELTWDIFTYTVVLQEFHADYQNPFWIPYRISCTVVRDDATSPFGPTIALVLPVTADIGAAADQCAEVGIGFTQVQSALADPNVTTLGSGAHMLALSSINQVQVSIVSSIASVEAILEGAFPMIAGSTETMASDIIAATTAAQGLASLVSARGYAGRAARNLSNAST